MNSPPIKIKEATKNTCSRILTPKQVGLTCWFMATFVAMFYSQRSRKILLEASENWDKNKELFTILKHILDDKYLKTESRESEDYRKFSDNTFIDILRLLHKENKKTFMYNPERNEGFTPHFYIGRLYNLLKIDYTIFEYDIENDFLVYSLLNEEYNDDINIKIIQKYNKLKKHYEMIHYLFKIKSKSKFEKNIKSFSRFINDPSILFKDNLTKFIKNDRLSRRLKEPPLEFNDAHKRFENNPSILIVFVRNGTYNSNIYGEGVHYKNGNNKLKNRIDDIEIKNSIQSMEEQIFYRGSEYNLDSVISGDIQETNLYRPEHIIAGITCKKKKYVYNGWTRMSMDPAMATTKITRDIPCELMKQNWNIKDDVDYCLNSLNCQLDLLTKKNAKLCFNFSKGYRTLIYVKKNNKSNTSSSYSPQMSSDISSVSNISSVSSAPLVTSNKSNNIIITKDKIVLLDIILNIEIISILKNIELSNITHFIIKSAEENYDNEVLYELLLLIENMKNIKVLDFSGFNIDSSKFSYIEGDTEKTSHTITFVKLFTRILLKLKKLKYLNFTNNIIDTKSYNNIFRLGNSNAKPDITNAIMLITDENKVRRIKFNTRDCSTPKFIDIIKDYKNPIYFYNSHSLINYKNPAVDKQIKSIIG
jgi:hypothetical protein